MEFIKYEWECTKYIKEFIKTRQGIYKYDKEFTNTTGNSPQTQTASTFNQPPITVEEKSVRSLSHDFCNSHMHRVVLLTYIFAALLHRVNV